MNPIILIGGVIYMYLLVTRPTTIAVLFFTLTIADINLEMGGLPLNIRAIVGLTLLGRTVIMQPGEDDPGFYRLPGVQTIIFFLFYGIIISAFYDLMRPDIVKAAALTIISVYLAWYYFYREKNYRLFQQALIIAGIICLADLGFTYAYYGQFPVQRIYQFIMKVPIPVDEEGEFLEVINHNFYGMTCGVCGVFVLNEFLNNRLKGWVLILVPLMMLGTLMSTSRSSLLAFILISLFLIGKGMKRSDTKKNVYKIISMITAAIFAMILFFTTLYDLLPLESDFIDNITMRLIDEPIAVLNKQLGYNYNVQSLDAMDWRGEAAAHAYEEFMKMDFQEQFFGIGNGGFLARNLGHGLNPHNGILLILIESGILGTAIYFTLLFVTIRKSLSRPDISSLTPALVFILIYCIGQNGELTNSATIMVVGLMIAENTYRSHLEQTAPENLMNDE
ncbi:MAG: hypothetical protein NVV59_08585 [Chitinophagaceae bacterium]|nr:hypothetical protein [Chitinophagaceae bacterium]